MTSTVFLGELNKSLQAEKKNMIWYICHLFWKYSIQLTSIQVLSLLIHTTFWLHTCPFYVEKNLQKKLSFFFTPPACLATLEGF